MCIHALSPSRIPFGVHLSDMDFVKGHTFKCGGRKLANEDDLCTRDAYTKYDRVK